MHHHSFVTVLGVSVFTHMKACNNGFFTQVGHVGPNAGQHEEFLAFSHPVSKLMTAMMA